MPTGTPIPNVADRLREAAKRVLLRDGAGAVTSRAVTTEAGLAKGILHRHFADVDALLATLVLARLERLDAISAELRRSAGTATVAGNLAVALTAALDPSGTALVALVAGRRTLRERLRVITPVGVPLLAEATRLVATYLTAERGLGRIRIDADVDALAVALVGGAHLAGGGAGAATQDELLRFVDGVVAAGDPAGVREKCCR